MEPPEPAGCAVCAATDWKPLFAKGSQHYFRCGRCRLVVAQPFPTPEELRAIYHREYAEASGAGAVLAAEREMARATARWRLGAVRSEARDNRWLEVGCSTGAFLEEATAAGLDIEGVDLSDVACAEARSHGLRARALPLGSIAPQHPYDVVAAFDLIEHVPDPAELLRQVRSVLRPRGYLALTTPDTASLTARLMGRAWHFYIPFVHLVHFDRANLRALLESAGFEVLLSRSAAKCLTFDYTVEQFAIGNPLLHAVSRAVKAVLPQRLRRFVFRLPIGEQLVLARLRPV